MHSSRHQCQHIIYVLRYQNRHVTYIFQNIINERTYKQTIRITCTLYRILTHMYESRLIMTKCSTSYYLLNVHITDEESHVIIEEACR